MAHANSFFFFFLSPLNEASPIFLLDFAWEGAFFFPLDITRAASLPFPPRAFCLETKGGPHDLWSNHCPPDKSNMGTHAPFLRRLKGSLYLIKFETGSSRVVSSLTNVFINPNTCTRIIRLPLTLHLHGPTWAENLTHPMIDKSHLSH